MIIVDTNVWSELMRPHPNLVVQRWETNHATDLWLSTVVIAEMLSGVHLMPDGRRKRNLLANYDALIAVHHDRIVPFDLASARRYGEVLAFLEKNGRNPATADAQIAATALVRGMTLATRNVRDFDGLGLTLIDPWQD